MIKKVNCLNKVFIAIFSSFLFTINLSAQAPKKNTSTGGATVKGVLAADFDCTVKLNGAPKIYNVKAYTPLDVILKVGNNTFEAVSIDKKSTIKNTVIGKAGEKLIVEISFFDDNKFLDYIKTGNMEMTAAAVKKNPRLINNDDGTLLAPPLQVAIENSQLEMVNFLMSKGASFTKPENIYPLHLAIKYASSVSTKDKIAPDKLLVDLFLSKGCKVTDKDDAGNTPLHCAARAGKVDLVTFLIKMGADVNAKNDFDETPLKIAQDKGFITILNNLRSEGGKEK